MFYFLIPIGFIIFFMNDFVYSLSCLDEYSEARDWTVVVKPPSQPSDDPNLKFGSKYLFKYKSQDDVWEQEKDISNTNSVIGLTLGPVYNNPEIFSYVQYGDKSPKNQNFDSFKNKKSFFGQDYSNGKGSLIWNSEGAIWLIYNAPESLPPFSTKRYSLTRSSLLKGHNYLCLSLKLADVSMILSHLTVAKPKIYSLNINPNLEIDEMVEKRILENVDALKNSDVSKLNSHDKGNVFELPKGNHRFMNEMISESSLGSKNKNKFKLFSRSDQKPKSIWARLKTSPIQKLKYFSSKSISFIQNMKSKFKSKCSNGKITSLFSKLLSKDGLKNKKTIYWDNDSNWILCSLYDHDPCNCISDFNRSAINYKRGSLDVCLYDKNLNKAIHDLQEQSC